MFGSKNIVGLSLALSFVLISCIAITTPSFAKSVNCQRFKTNGVFQFESQNAYDSWFPKQINIDVYSFKTLSGRKSLKYGTNTLLPNGTLIRGILHAATGAHARYKCNMKPEEVLAARTSQTPSPPVKTELTKCYEGVLESCNEKALCGRATSRQWVDGTKVMSWEIKGWQEYVQEAKRRGLSCGVSEASSQSTTSSSTSSTTSSSSKADYAKAFCKDIGFTAGTEKFGECVLKMMVK